MDEINQELTEEMGGVKIADEVVAIIAGIAATEVVGVAGMSGGIAGGIAEMLGRKNLAKGVKVEVGEKEAAIDLYIIVEYGTKISVIANNIIQKIKYNVENYTGLKVNSITVNVQGVRV